MRTPASADPLEADLGGAKGAIVDAALGTTDAIEWSAAARAGFFPLYAMWNNGLKVTAVGGEDSISNLHGSKLVGSQRTYVFTGGRGLDMHAWLDGMRAGRAFVTNGPLVELTVNGALPGETVTLPAGGGSVSLQARVRSIVPLQKVTLYFNGQAVEDIPLGADRRGADFSKTLQVAASGWYHLRAEGAPADRFPLDTGYPQGFTNPVWVIVGQPSRPRPCVCRVRAEVDRQASEAGRGLAGMALAEGKGPRVRAVRRGAKGLSTVCQRSGALKRKTKNEKRIEHADRGRQATSMDIETVCARE